MKVKITDLLDGMEENSISIQTRNVASARRIKELTMQKIEESGSDTRKISHVSPRRRYRSGRRVLTLAAVMALLLAMGATAYAVGSHAGFFNSAFGRGIRGQEAGATEVYSPDGELLLTEQYPAEERVENDNERTEALLGDYVSAVGQSVTLGDYTVTVEDVVLDENGIGAVSVQVENPKGHGFSITGAFIGDTVPDPYLGYSVSSSGGKAIGSHNYVVDTLYSETKLHFIYYLAPIAPLERDEDILLHFCVISSSKNESQDATITIPAAERVPTKKLSTEGMELSISPVGMLLRYEEQPESTGALQYAEYHNSEIVIRYENGDSYTVLTAGTVNTPISTAEGNCVWIAFNRAVDVENVQTVTVTGRHDYEGANTGGMQSVPYSYTLSAK